MRAECGIGQQARARGFRLVQYDDRAGVLVLSFPRDYPDRQARRLRTARRRRRKYRFAIIPGNRPPSSEMTPLIQ